ncbi:MAG: hypothetical protein DRP62_08125, partial [Planctomycetota bacterium]
YEPPEETTLKTVEQPNKPAESTIIRRSYKPEPVDLGEETLELNLPEKLKIVQLLALVGEYLHLDYMYDPVQLRGKDEVTLRLRGPIKIKDLYPLLESVLKFKGLAMARKGNLVTIVPASEALNIDPALLDAEKGSVQYGDVIVTRIFKLKHIDPTSAKNLLAGMKLGADINTSISEAKMLIVTGYAYRMPRIEQLLRMIDKPGEPKQFKFRQLKYTMATKLAPQIKTLAEQLGTVSVSVAAAPAPPAPRHGRRPAPRPAPSPKKEAAVYLDADERTNRIMMIGLAEQLDAVEKLIDVLDVEQRDLRTLRLYEIQHVGAEEVKEKLTELGIIGGGKGKGTTPYKPTKDKTAPSSAGGVVSEPLVEEPQVVIIDATNSLLVNATDEQHSRIASIIGYVDSETLEQAIPYEIYQLENQSPVEIAEILNKLVQETVKDKEGKIQKVVKKEENITIIGDENTFSLIVYASKKNQEWIKKLIDKLDKRRPQVLIDVSLVEITRDKEFAYDLSLITNARDLVTGNIGITGKILPLGAGASTVLEGGFNLKDAEGKYTKSVVGFYNDDRIQALLNAIDSKGYGRVLAQPKVLVNDNEEGLIETTEKTYVKEETTSYTSEGIPITTSKWQEYPAVIKLSITPNISEGDLLRLVIDMTREDFEKKENAPPDYRTSNVNTTVTVPDGSTIILGGLTKLKQAKGGSKVPLLGDIPLVGALFRTVSNSDKTSKLYIFVKANILRPDETIGLGQLQQISARNKEAFEKAEDEFQAHQSIPGVEPEPIDPLHILEQD